MNDIGGALLQKISLGNKLFEKYLTKKKIKLPIKKINKFKKIYFKKLDNKYFSIFDIKAKNNYDNTYNSLLESIAITIITEKSLCFVSISVAGSQPMNVLTGISSLSLTM